MKTPSNLQLIALACLSRAQNKRKTLYELMIEVNHIFALADTPYSPGAFYPAIKKLSKAKMININQDGCIIEQAGITHLEASLMRHPLPDSFMGILYRLIAASILADRNLRREAVKRIDIELIKFNQNQSQAGQGKRRSELAPSFIRQHISSCLRRIALDLRDY